MKFSRYALKCDQHNIYINLSCNSCIKYYYGCINNGSCGCELCAKRYIKYIIEFYINYTISIVDVNTIYKIMCDTNFINGMEYILKKLYENNILRSIEDVNSMMHKMESDAKEFTDRFLSWIKKLIKK